MPKIKNIIIFIAIAASFVLIYVFFIKKDVLQDNLISSPAANLPNVNGSNTTDSSDQASSDADAQVFLTQLLNVKNIKINVAIFSDPAWFSLHDSSITLVPDGTEGRSNPFAAIGNDTVVPIAPAMTKSGAVGTPAATNTTTGTTPVAPVSTPTPTNNTPVPKSSPSPANNN